MNGYRRELISNCSKSARFRSEPNRNALVWFAASEIWYQQFCFHYSLAARVFHFFRSFFFVHRLWIPRRCLFVPFWVIAIESHTWWQVVQKQRSYWWCRKKRSINLDTFTPIIFILFQNTSILDELNRFPFYLLLINEQKMFALQLKRNQQKPKLKIGPFAELNYETACTVISSYS